jgi:uncharacterized membrane protein YsdA (DUF1294 family)
MFVDFRRLVSSVASFFFLAALYKFICSAISVWLFRCFDPKSCARVSNPVVRFLLLLLFPPSHRRKAWHVSTAFFMRRKKESKLFIIFVVESSIGHPVARQLFLFSTGEGHEAFRTPCPFSIRKKLFCIIFYRNQSLVKQGRQLLKKRSWCR